MKKIAFDPGGGGACRRRSWGMAGGASARPSGSKAAKGAARKLKGSGDGQHDGEGGLQGSGTA